MVMNVENQLYSFLVMLYGGIILGFLYDIYRVVRIILKLKRIGTDIGDIIFWIVGTIIVITALYISNYVEMRFYTIIGFAIGVLIYNILLSPFILKLLLFIYKVIAFVFIKIYLTLSFPFKLIYKTMLVPYRLIKKFFSIQSNYIQNVFLHFTFFKKKK